jgi:hypothetical protein
MTTMAALFGAVGEQLVGGFAWDSCILAGMRRNAGLRFPA